MDFNGTADIFKQNKNDVSQPTRRPKQTNPTTIVAKAVTASKEENNELIPIGKYGFALAGDVKLNYYQLLLYGSKSSVIANCIITKDFKYSVKNNNTIQFLSKETWHLEFANTNDAIEFNTHIALVLWKLNGSKKLFWMDLYYPPRIDKTATFGGVVEVTYVAKTVQGTTFGPEVSNNIKDDKYLSIIVNQEGWERSLLGVNDNTCRIVCLPAAEMGAWKILTDGCQCLCLIVTVKNVYEIKENSVTNLPVDKPEPLEALENNLAILQTKEIIDNNDSIVDIVVPSKTIESLYEELEKLKVDNTKTKERLTRLEALFKETSKEKIENSNNSELKKSMKTIYKSIIQEFPADQSFSGSHIQTQIKAIFHNALMCNNQSLSND